MFARGPGAGARNSIGIALVTGMIIGTAFTLFVVPAIYTLVAKVHGREDEAYEADIAAADAAGGDALPAHGAASQAELTTV